MTSRDADLFPMLNQQNDHKNYIKEYNPSNFIDHIQSVLFDGNVRKLVTYSCTKIS